MFETVKIAELMARRHDTLAVASRGCISTLITCMCPLYGEILGRTMLCHARHAVTSHLLKFPWCFEYIFSDFYFKFSLTRTLPRGTKAADLLRKEKKKVTINA